MNVITPCVSLCKLEDGKCVGCKRTRDEIANWRSYSDEERLDIIRRLEYGKKSNR